MLYKNIFIVFFIVFKINLAYSQTCKIRITGEVVDVLDKKPLESVNLFLVEQTKNTQTDATGMFSFNDVCKGTYHLRISHIGCETKTMFLEIDHDTTIFLTLDHSFQTLHEIHIKGELNKVSTLQTKTIKKEKIKENSNENLSTLLENLNGVSSLKNGTIAKPVIQGFSGNRLTILNNGVPQNGQQWGADHAPEIDPLVAKKLQIIKGAASLAYPGSNAGNIIIISPDNPDLDPHVHGSLNYFFESNGNGHGVRAEAKQGSKKIAWKIGVTHKNFGDRKTPSYYLKNTGNSEWNGDVIIEKTKKNAQTQLYFSTFNANLGILRGSQIGNLEDLNKALTQEIPFYTEPTFGRKITAPKQSVNHNLLKLTFKNLKVDHLNTEAFVAIQSNNRKEFDIRRNSSNSLPSLSIIQNSLHGELKIHIDKGEHQHLSTGIHAKLIDNTNNPQTGILPLLPDFRSLEPSAFFVFETAKKNIHFEFGARYDGVFQNIKAISKDLPRRIINYDKTFNNFSASLGLHTKIKNTLNLELQSALGNRNPAINELYSNGLHQGVAGIELGNLNLISEKAFKNTLSLNYVKKEWLNINLSTYFNFVKDYIFLKPSLEKRLTIRGAFPVFNYQQTNATIVGLDTETKIKLQKSIYFSNQISLIKGRENNRTLIYLPQNRIKNEVSYEPENKLIKINITYTRHLRYSEIEADQDFAPPPPGFGLLSSSIHKEFIKKIKLSLTINNALNTSYRLYLNRLRYYSDDLGRSIIMGINIAL